MWDEGDRPACKDLITGSKSGSGIQGSFAEFKRCRIILGDNSGQSNFGSYTLLAQPDGTASLEIGDAITGKWGWAKSHSGTITINGCDALRFLTGRCCKSTVHPVASLPVDRSHLNRLGLLHGKVCPIPRLISMDALLTCRRGPPHRTLWATIRKFGM